MARSRVTNRKKIKRLEKLIGKPVIWAAVRGGNWHPAHGHYTLVKCAGDEREYMVFTDGLVLRQRARGDSEFIAIGFDGS